MNRSTLPRPVERIRIFLWVQMSLLAVGLLLIMLYLQALSAGGGIARWTAEQEVAWFYLIFFTLFAALPLLALSARLVRLGRKSGWVLTLIAQVAVVSLVYPAVLLNLFFGASAVAFLGIAIWIAVQLLSAEIRRFFFHRDAVPVG